MDCLFCKIIDRAIPADLIYEDDAVIAISDISPQAPHHKLILPKKHIASLNDLTGEDALVMGQIMLVAQTLASQLGISDNGYRLVANCGKDAHQSVFHIHFHLLGGRELNWPPG